ncbi:hypothetical protein BW14_06365 [Bifidobacterium sp. UTBIF-68]|uniref:TetR/AcrR family transcriptional regulator n=1 Tax=Bifidobacterium sp. UTBIF-68 TaxID=1465262 RepID=UPI001129CEB3|nr:TetR/AcrR family transcriptional regulator [Bifidobacterium sp. UTBIF-68]TPF93161.1 hypothetical protein BW14_06365 [Bifidobacterium sp. UTBIF-68]
MAEAGTRTGAGEPDEGRSVKPMDRRSRRTRVMLQSALVKLLETKPLNKISVMELTRLADVNRATFYVHYTDIYALFDQLKRELIDSYKDIITRHRGEILQDDYEPLIHEIFEFATANESMSLLVTGKSGDTFSGDLIAAVGAYCNELIDPISASHASLAPDDGRTQAAETVRDYHFVYLAAGIVGSLKEWYRRGRREPIDLVVRIAANNTHAIGLAMLARNIGVSVSESSAAHASGAVVTVGR